MFTQQKPSREILKRSCGRFFILGVTNLKEKKELSDLRHIGIHKLYAIRFCHPCSCVEFYLNRPPFKTWSSFYRRKFSRIRKARHRNKKSHQKWKSKNDKLRAS